MKIRPFTLEDVEKVRLFTDRAIGTNYYSTAELQEIYKKSLKDGRDCTLILEDENGDVRGVRITYPPGNWQKGKGQGLSPEKWQVPMKDTAYFQSLFVDPTLTGEGWGKKLSFAAIEILRELKTKAIVTHSWKESPHDSSGRYLRALGFRLVATHPLYWKEVDYVCTRCGKPCLCTAEEMILNL